MARFWRCFFFGGCGAAAAWPAPSPPPFTALAAPPGWSSIELLKSPAATTRANASALNARSAAEMDPWRDEVPYEHRVVGDDVQIL
eukprot:240767-Pyramimonas_sp.AAC.1